MTRPSLFVLIGDSFLCEERRKEILDSLAKEIGPELAVTVRRSTDVPVTTTLSEARTLPFLSRAQAFVVREADQFTKGDLELWESYFKAPPPASFFIFEAESLEKNHPLLEWAKRFGQLFLLRPQREKITADFISRKLKQAQKKITAEALELLESRLGDSVIFLDSFLDQLILHSGERPEIGRADVEAEEEKLIRFEGFDLLRAIAERNLPRALEILNDLLELNGQDAPSLIGLLHWQFRRFWEAKKWRRDSPFFAELRRFSLGDLEKILEGLFELDCALKTGRAEGRYEIEGWLINAIG